MFETDTPSIQAKTPFPIPHSLIVLGLGSNLGDSHSIVINAVKVLGDVLRELRRASLYETEPLYYVDQGRFINTAVAGFYGVNQKPLEAARELLVQLHKIEERFGRKRDKERRWGERFLDVDILLFGDLTINESDIIIPHPRLKERRFALEPLLEIMPDATEPGTGLSYRSICQALPDQGVKRLPSLSEKR